MNQPYTNMQPGDDLTMQELVGALARRCDSLVLVADPSARQGCKYVTGFKGQAHSILGLINIANGFGCKVTAGIINSFSTDIE